MKTSVLLFRNDYGWRITPFKDTNVITKVFLSLREAKDYIQSNNFTAFRAYHHSDF